VPARRSTRRSRPGRICRGSAGAKSAARGPERSSCASASDEISTRRSGEQEGFPVDQKSS
jgi:hypothetical protein